ncbi:MAG: sensor histidine kinase N-terminal domain-containing protein [Rhodocyclaceae bacterium]|nr:sensor histidine kinase N-terminal domain-containing protein [Rhodocyclaceae bacterium]
MTTRWFSLRQRLLAMLLGGMAACWLVTLAWSFADAHHEIDELFDAQLAQTAQALLAISRRHGDHEIESLEGRLHPYQRSLAFQIWHRDGELLLRSPNAPTGPLAQADGFSETDGPAGHWRLYTQWDEKRRHQVQVAERHDARDELTGQIALRLLMPALLGLPLLGAWAWLATRQGLAPLDAVARQIAAREPDRLHPLEPSEAPEEIRPLVDSLNALFGRVEQALEAERRFTADAAHELRTPLAALAAQAQVAWRARDEAERRHAMELLEAGTTRAARLVDQLLTLARLDPQQARIREGRVALDRLAEEVCAAAGSLAVERQTTLELDAEPATVAGNPDMLRILLRNLVDNALRYTPGGGNVQVRVHPTPGGARLEITDNGPGIPQAERDAVFRRFHRLAGQETEGSGLGLSIVARIAELHGARVALDDGAGGGLRVRVEFAAA